jgi:MOSC domain-containing protein YiiM
MKVISTNTGLKRTIVFRGKEVITGIFKAPVIGPIYLGKDDVEGDDVIDRKYHGGVDKACYLFSADHYAQWKIEYPDLDWKWGMFGENLTIEGLDEAKIHIGDVFKIGSAKVQVTQPRQPCFKLGIRLNDGKAVKRFVEKEQCGIYIRVLEEGYVKQGDTVSCVEKKDENFTVKEIFHFINYAKNNQEAIQKALLMTELAEACSRDLIKYSGLKG